MTPTREELIKHDYAKALENFNDFEGTISAQDPLPHNTVLAIRHALKIAQLVTGNPSFDMLDHGSMWLPSKHKGVANRHMAGECFQSMITQAIKEVAE